MTTTVPPPASADAVVGVIVAAGSGLRLGGDVPKALVPLAGQTLVRRSANALVAGGCTHLVVVVAAGLEGKFSDALAGVGVPVHLTTGGERRQDSVVNGLHLIDLLPELEQAQVVLVHDAARALVPAWVVAEVISAVRRGAAAVIPVVPMIDSVRRDHTVLNGATSGMLSSVVDRADLRLVQTPQGFDRQVLREAHAQAIAEGLEVTDDAAVCEALGHQVVLVEGSRDALKVTESFDLVVAEAICRQREEAQ